MPIKTHLNQLTDDDQSKEFNGNQLKKCVLFDERQTLKNENFDECAICLNAPQVDPSSPLCGHTFCFECLVQSGKIKKECPTCKQVIPFIYHNGGKTRYDQPIDHAWDLTEDGRMFNIQVSLVILPFFQSALNDAKEIIIDDGRVWLTRRNSAQRYRIDQKYYLPLKELKERKKCLVILFGKVVFRGLGEKYIGHRSWPQIMDLIEQINHLNSEMKLMIAKEYKHAEERSAKSEVYSVSAKEKKRGKESKMESGLAVKKSEKRKKKKGKRK